MAAKRWTKTSSQSRIWCVRKTTFGTPFYGFRFDSRLFDSGVRYISSVYLSDQAVSGFLLSAGVPFYVLRRHAAIPTRSRASEEATVVGFLCCSLPLLFSIHGRIITPVVSGFALFCWEDVFKSVCVFCGTVGLFAPHPESRGLHTACSGLAERAPSGVHLHGVLKAGDWRFVRGFGCCHGLYLRRPVLCGWVTGTGLWPYVLVLECMGGNFKSVHLLSLLRCKSLD